MVKGGTGAGRFRKSGGGDSCSEKKTKRGGEEG